MFNADPEWPTDKILDEIKAKASWAEKKCRICIAAVFSAVGSAQ
jgi:hypothetical protein